MSVTPKVLMYQLATYTSPRQNLTVSKGAACSAKGTKANTNHTAPPEGEVRLHIQSSKDKRGLAARELQKTSCMTKQQRSNQETMQASTMDTVCENRRGSDRSARRAQTNHNYRKACQNRRSSKHLAQVTHTSCHENTKPTAHMRP